MNYLRRKKHLDTARTYLHAAARALVLAGDAVEDVRLDAECHWATQDEDWRESADGQQYGRTLDWLRALKSEMCAAATDWESKPLPDMSKLLR